MWYRLDLKQKNLNILIETKLIAVNNLIKQNKIHILTQQILITSDRMKVLKMGLIFSFFSSNKSPLVLSHIPVLMFFSVWRIINDSIYVVSKICLCLTKKSMVILHLSALKIVDQNSKHFKFFGNSFKKMYNIYVFLQPTAFLICHIID